MDAIFKLLGNAVNHEQKMADLERYARSEYKKDWQHALAMLKQGQKPDFRGKIK